MVTGLYALYGAIALASSSMLASASPADHLGHGSLKARILGGSGANKSNYPFIVYLQNTAEQTYCGGSIISDDWVLTAAHCIKTASASDLHVYIGQAEYNPDPSKATAVSSVTTHPGYDDSTMVNDLSLIKLATPITTNGNSSTISVDSSSVGDGVTLTALGWGYTSETGTTASKNLKEADLTTLSQAECGAKDTKFTGNNGATICVAADKGGDTCPGDSGGPLIRQVNGNNVLVGVTSFGTAGSGQSITVNCGGSGMVSLFTHVSYYKSFIESTTGGLRQIQGSNTDEG
ncbi:Kallikrein-14 [Coemansia sp. RSA 2559]|nr:Kallikrein-14 [Coemansia sp. RSA 2559]KAJ2854062.1 Kallikrein-14 [Coemansia erecta]